MKRSQCRQIGTGCVGQDTHLFHLRNGGTAGGSFQTCTSLGNLGIVLKPPTPSTKQNTTPSTPTRVQRNPYLLRLTASKTRRIRKVPQQTTSQSKSKRTRNKRLQTTSKVLADFALAVLWWQLCLNPSAISLFFKPSYQPNSARYSSLLLRITLARHSRIQQVPTKSNQTNLKNKQNETTKPNRTNKCSTKMCRNGAADPP